MLFRSNVGGIENIVKPNDTALLCANNNSSEFADQLLKLAENDQLRASMAKNGWLHVKEKYHYTRLVTDMENLYDQLLRK